MKYLFGVLSLLLFNNVYSQNKSVGIGTTNPHASAALEIASNNKGLLPPRMTYAERNAIVNPARGLIIYCIDCSNNGELQYFDGLGWRSMNIGLASIPANLPAILTKPIINIGQNSAIGGGNISSDGGSPVLYRGVCWDTLSQPTLNNQKSNDGFGSGEYLSNLIGLLPNKKYYVRAYAINSIGTVFGSETSFTTDTIFSGINIGSQTWAGRNLDVVTYRNGDSIPQITDPLQWSNMTTGAWCWYNNDSSLSNGGTYGRLYNWYAVNDPRGLAPSGWHIPTDAEWSNLETYLGRDWASGALKETGFSHWASPNNYASNVTGFTALPGGMRDFNGVFRNKGTQACWWSSNAYNLYFSWYRSINNTYSNIDRYYYYKTCGFSIRCLRD